MRNFIKELFNKRRESKINNNQQELKKKVEEGVKKAVKEYGEVFHKLAEYDKK